jgi:DinB superfamily
MTSRKDQILKRLAEEGAKAAEYLRGLPPAAWEQQVYTTGGLWRVREVLCHFVSTEVAVARYGRDILAGGLGAPDDLVIDEFNETQVGGMADREPAGLIVEFERQRAVTLNMVQGMGDADFDRVGRHPWFGRAPLEDMLRLIYRHTMIHLRDVRRALETGQPVPHLDVRPPAETQPAV